MISALTFSPLAYIAVAGVGLRATIRNKEPRRLRFTAVYLGFVVLASSLGLAVMLVAPVVYPIIYFVVQLAHGIAVALLGLDLAIALLPRKAAEIVGAFLLTTLAIAFVREIPAWTLAGILDLTITADIVAALFVLCAFWVDAPWTHELSWTAGALALIVAGDAGPSFLWSKGSLSPASVTFGALPGLILMSFSQYPAAKHPERSHAAAA